MYGSYAYEIELRLENGNKNMREVTTRRFHAEVVHLVHSGGGHDQVVALVIIVKGPFATISIDTRRSGT